MDLRNLGNTDITTSAVVFGGGFVGGLLINSDDETRRDAIRIAIDGGIRANNLEELIKCDPDVVVFSSAIFKDPDGITSAVKKCRSSINNAQVN